ncbi:MAG TPA: SRPBCC family protein [Acidimicrobiales bacterium]|nr:SRPBCC family protein [Acidimicrobiales bacterium]
MELTNEFTVPVPVERAWEVLTDVELIAPCLPGAQLQEIEGDEYRGVVKVKVGPITAQSKGAATFQEQDEAARRLVLKAEGRDTRGQGSAAAVITVSMQEQAGSTHVTVDTDLTIKGKVAQFGRGMIADVSAKLLDQFVECLEGKLEAPATAAAPAEAPAPAPAPTDAAVAPDPDEAVPAAATGAPAAPASETVTAPSGTTSTTSSTAGSTAPPTVRKVSQPEAKAVDLMDAAGGSVAKRVGPVVLVLLVLWLLGRRRSNKGA